MEEPKVIEDRFESFATIEPIELEVTLADALIERYAPAVLALAGVALGFWIGRRS